LRPDASIVAAYSNAIAGHDGHALMLGITPELADLASKTTAVDISPGAIANAWSGDTPARRALQGDWLDMPLQRREFTAAIGDGSLSWIAFAQYPRLFAHLARLLLPGARLAIRLYETPEPGETIAQVREAAMYGKIAGFHAFKWRLAMAIASETGDPALPVKQMHKTFEREFAQRSALSAATGWTIDEIAEIDAYAGQDLVYYFPTRRELLAHLPPSFTDPRFVASGDYELAERCPILVADFLP
jgi:SAM-dependent methyltransferase